MQGSLVRITAPSDEPVSLDQLKEHLRLPAGNDEDNYLSGLIAAVRQRVEGTECWAQFQLLTATFEWRLDEFPADTSPIVIPRPPLQTVEFVKYIDLNGVEQTFGESSPITEYIVDAKSPHEPERGEIYLAFDGEWPEARKQHNAVRVRFDCGFGNVADVPEAVRQWILIHAATMYENREQEVVDTGQSAVSLGFVDQILNPYRVKDLGFA